MQFVFNTNGVFTINNVRLKHLNTPERIHLEYGEFSMGIEDWVPEFSGGGAQIIESTPASFPETTVSLVVTNSEGQRSTAVLETIESSVCQ